MEQKRRVGWAYAFLAILYYEFLWNVRKKKVVGLFVIVFAVATLQLALPPIISYAVGQPLGQNPTFVFQSAASPGGFFVFLLAVATTMNTISGEFESGSIIPLLTKPVSRTLVFTGKIVAAFLTLLGAYTFLGVYLIIGGYLILGPQDNLHLLPLGILGLTFGTLVWTSIVVTLGTFSKNSIVAALGAFGLFLGLAIVGQVLSSFLGQSAILFYTPGDGPQGTTGSCMGAGFVAVDSFQTGTNALGVLLMQWALNPSLNLTVCGFRFGTGEIYTIASDPISSAASRALGVSAAYTVVLLLVSWFSFRRSEMVE